MDPFVSEYTVQFINEWEIAHRYKCLGGSGCEGGLQLASVLIWV
jgi:hypothetical protein